MHKKFFGVAVVFIGILVLAGAGCGNKGPVDSQKQTAENQEIPDRIASIATESPDKHKNQGEAADETLSEQPDQATYNEYFTAAYLAKLPAGAEFNPGKIVKTKIFTAGEQFCTSMDMKKQIPANTLSTAIYDVSEKKDAQPRMGTFPQALGPGNSVGCEPMTETVGKYEYKIYINDVLAIVLPFEVK